MSKGRIERRGNQIHGLAFERMIIRRFDLIESSSNTSLWDARTRNGVPVSIKKVKYGNELILGDLFRQANIDEDFFIAIGFWSTDISEVDEIIVLKMKKEVWQGHFDKKTLTGARRMLELSKGRADEHIKATWDGWRKTLYDLWESRTSNFIKIRARYRKNGNHEMKAAMNSMDFYRAVKGKRLTREVQVRKGELKYYIKEIQQERQNK